MKTPLTGSRLTRSRHYAILLFFISLLLARSVQAQRPLHRLAPRARACGFIDLKLRPIHERLELQDPDSLVIAIVNEIQAVAGMHQDEENQNFKIAISNAEVNLYAISEPITDDDKHLFIHRWIVYNADLVTSVKNNFPLGAIYLIFAHEIAHHLNGDNFKEENGTDPTVHQKRELNADAFAGYLCYQLGLLKNFRLNDCLGVFDLDDVGGTDSDHPPKQLRIDSFTNGWNTAEAYHRLSCSILNKLDGDPVIAIDALNRSGSSELKAQKKNPASQLAAIAAIMVQNSVAAKGDTVASSRSNPVIVIRVKDSLKISQNDTLLAASRVVNIKAKPTKPIKRTDYLIDEKNVIWARYPNGVPYVVGVVQTVRKP